MANNDEHSSRVAVLTRWLDVYAAAAYLSMSPVALYKMVERRQIPFVRKRRRVFFDRHALDEWMAKDAFSGSETAR
ncbi:MAG: helix-turn-helix domain-containing protein [Acidobacteriota bacterium]